MNPTVQSLLAVLDSFSAVIWVVLIIALYFGAAPLVFQRVANGLVSRRVYDVSKRARALHQSLVVADLHADPLLSHRNLLRRSTMGHVDLPRLEAGNVALQVFATVNKFPGNTIYRGKTYYIDVLPLLATSLRWPRAAWFSPKGRAMHQAWKLHDFAARSGGRLKVVKSTQDLGQLLERRADGMSVVGGILAIEGLYCLDGRVEAIDELYDAGFRIAGLTHFCDSEVGGSSNGVVAGGLTDFGRRVVARIEERRMVIDLAHASPALIVDVLAVATRPVIVSHTGVRATYDNVRNLSDDEVRGVAAGGGLIGIGYMPDALGIPSPTNIVRAMRHVANLVGVEHVACGSDYDGSVRVPFDAAGLAVLTEYLLRDGFSDTEIAAIMGGNVTRFFATYL